jgi:murein DD-endopeptidase MepM/ murein hydrolase activator NlpD
MKSDGTITKTWGNGTADIGMDHEAYNRILCEMIAAAIGARGSEDSLRAILAEINMTPQWHGHGQDITIHFQGVEIAKLYYDKRTNSYISKFKEIYGSAFNSNLKEVIVQNDLGYAKVVDVLIAAPVEGISGKGTTYIGHADNARDFAAPAGTSIYSTMEGVVTRVVMDYENDFNYYDGKGTGGATSSIIGKTASYGNFIEIEVSDGSKIIYAHQQQGHFVQVGDLVYAGQQIGLVGSTGHSSAEHLHFQVKVATSGNTVFDSFAWK